MVETLVMLWPGVGCGGVLLVLGTWTGWLLGRYRAIPLVGCIEWWLVRVVGPWIATPSWWRRTFLIFGNNITILAVVVAVGRWFAAAVVGAAGVGLSLGIALRVITRTSWGFSLPAGARRDRRVRRLVRVGLTLNLLEPPAILMALGVALARGSVPLTAVESWALFGLWVAPAMLAAAGGEALWLGAGLRTEPSPEAEPSSGSASRRCDGQVQP